MKHLILVLLLFLNFTYIYSQTDSTVIITPSNKEIIKSSVPNKVSIYSEKPILIKNVSENKNVFWDLKFSFTAIMAFIGALLGLSLTFISLYDKFLKKSKVFSKIISFYTSDGEFDLKLDDKPKQMQYGIRYVLKLLLNVTQENLNYTEMKVFVKFNGNENEYEGRIHSPRNFTNCKVGSENFQLILPHDKIIYYMSALEKDKSTLGYLTFIVPDINKEFKGKWIEKYNKPNYIRLDFIGSDGKTYKSNEMELMIEEEKYIWEDSIWIKTA
jgi:hypothetical protein